MFCILITVLLLKFTGKVFSQPPLRSSDVPWPRTTNSPEIKPLSVPTDAPRPNVMQTLEFPVENAPYPEINPTNGLDSDSELKSCPVKSGRGVYSYDDTTLEGPAQWGSLHNEFKTCESGVLQSPINIQHDMRLSGMRCGAKTYFVASLMQFTPMPNNWAFTCKVPGTCGWTSFLNKQYAVQNIHFHKPSEHYLSGVQYPLEAHIEHKSEDGKLIILAVLFRYGDGNSSVLSQGTSLFPTLDESEPLLSRLLDAVKRGNSSTNVNLEEIVDERKGFCAYMGSLTTPPCTEGVTYLISTNIPIVSERHVHAFWISTGFHFNGNSRPLKPINGREVTCYVK